MSSWLMKKQIKKRRFPDQPPAVFSSPLVSRPPEKKQMNKTQDIVIDKSVLFQIVNQLHSIPNIEEELPNIAFTFWEGKEFSYLHLLTVQSLAYYNPDLTIIIYSSEVETDIHSTWTTEEHSTLITNNLSDISLLRTIKNVQFVKVNMDMYFPGLSNMSCIHKSDVLRIMKLKEHGGIWFDFDILFFRPITPSLLRLRRHDIGIFNYEEHIAIGFIFSHANNPIFDYLITAITPLLGENSVSGYQSLGSRLWDRLLALPIIPSYIQLLPNDICYVYSASQIHSLYYNNKDITSNNTIGIHWYNSSPLTKNYINQTNFQNLSPNRCVMNKYVHQVIHDIQLPEFKEPHDISLVKDDSE
jgi:hypothetical protein